MGFSTRLHRTGYNLAVNKIELREGARNSTQDAEPPENLVYLNAGDSSHDGDPEESALLDKQQARLRQAVAKLPEAMRAILTLREQQKMSYKQISGVLKVSQKSVGALLMQARLEFARARGTSQVESEELSGDCEALLPQLSAYADNELSKKKKRTTEIHLNSCALCQLVVEDLTESAQRYGEILPVVPPGTLGDDILDGLREAQIATGLPTEPEPEPEPEPESESSFWDVAETAPQTRRSSNKKLIILSSLALTAVGMGLIFGLYGPQIMPERTVRPVQSNAVIESYDPGGGIVTETSTMSTIIEATRALEKGIEPEETSSTTETPDLADETDETDETDDPTTTPAVQPGSDTTPPAMPSGQSPSSGTFSKTKNVVLSWEAVDVPGKVTYSIEIESFFEDEYWQQITARSGLAGAAYGHDLGDTVERWRAWATDSAGNAGPATEWNLIQYSDSAGDD